MNRQQKIILIAALIAVTSFLHFTTRMHQPFLHLIHRQLYFVPIILTAYWFGKKRGLIIAALCAFLYLPWLLMNIAREPVFYYLDNLIQIGFYFLVAYLVGYYHDTRVSHYTIRFQKPEAMETLAPRAAYKVLLFINDSENSLKAAGYLAALFGRFQQLSVTILGIIRDQPEDIFPNTEKWEEAKKGNRAKLYELVERAKGILIENGIKPESITITTPPVSKSSVTDRIIEEHQRSRHDTIILGGTKMSKAEEFIFGNISVKLVRAGVAPVITVY